MELKICSKCYNELPATLEYFYRDPRNSSLLSKCKECRRKESREYWQKHGRAGAQKSLHPNPRRTKHPSIRPPAIQWDPHKELAKDVIELAYREQDRRFVASGMHPWVDIFAFDSEVFTSRLLRKIGDASVAV